MSEEIKQVD